MSRARSVVSEVVASGTFIQVERWAELLRQVGIVYEVRWSCNEHSTNRNDRAEMWVDRGEVDRARSAIRDASDADPGLMW
jgi:hypothetical protein